MRILIDETQLAAGVAKLAREIDTRYSDRPITVVAVLTGSVVLFADLIRRLSMPQRVGVIQASSYRGGTQAGELVIDAKMLIDVKDRDVLVVDDIFDTGATIAKLRDELTAMGAASVATAVLLRKVREEQHSVRPDFVAFEIPDEFVVGYGLDYLDMYRNLPYIAVLEPEEIAATSAQVG
ncbi:hypoxanthine phosphoribosyltransferase [Neorhodopirellula lusitana]|uniref:Hypoxanthine phosphoribosyltransferase n=1 Tax=Neorhodopirellula lusitana TaxID=445327 RepID=A0ABY1Q0Q5_9BACT|nr:hypoxanthine phosphoribosyltransferase [Neorhodopirellula lusitana]SMP54078.1 hypoxanthine phosphoribosyltransferase [Neorhodopirellula lusitana]